MSTDTQTHTCTIKENQNLKFKRQCHSRSVYGKCWREKREQKLMCSYYNLKKYNKEMSEDL